MIIAGIASLLGAPIWIVVTLVALLFWRSRWVRRRPGSFKCAVRRAPDDGTNAIVDVPSKFKLGYGLWVSNVFIWERGRATFRDILLPVDGIDEGGMRRAKPNEVKGLGEEPVIATLFVGSGAGVEVATGAEDRSIALGPFRQRAAEETEGRTPQ